MNTPEKPSTNPEVPSVTPGEEWSGIIPEPPSNQIPEPSIPDETPKIPENTTPEPVITPVQPTLITPVYTYVAPVISTPEPEPEPEPETKADLATSLVPESQTESKTEAPDSAPESYLTVEVPTTAAYQNRQAKIASLSLVATGLVLAGTVFIVAIIALIKSSRPLKFQKIKRIKDLHKNDLSAKDVNPLNL